MSANSPNPLIPQGSLQQQSNKAKSNVRMAVFTIVAIHAVFIVGVLMNGGCKKDEPKAEAPEHVGQPPATPDPFYNNPNDLTSAPPPAPATSTSAPAAPVTPVPPATGTDAFGAPIASATPTAPAIPSSPTMPATADLGTPAPAATGGFAESAPAVTMQQYKVQKGDSFYVIAKRYHTTVKKVAAANPNVDPARLQIGQVLNIPASAEAPAATSAMAAMAAPAPAGAATTVTYKVKPGDSLYAISRKYGTTVKAIQAANNMKTTRINVGQKLQIPSKAAPAAPAPEPAVTTPGVPVTPLPPSGTPSTF